MATTPTPPNPTPPAPVSAGTKFAAWAITGIYVLVACVLLYRFGLGDGAGNWERALTIFNAFSAIGFAAVGVLLGTTVQQVNVANAQKDAVNAKVSENRLAEHGAELSNAAAELLGKTSGLDGAALWSGKVGGASEARLRDAIVNMKKAMAERPAP